ncbi:hypothetical protein QQM79_07930 [Marinobacteraceae bacterium S3BR75-40.1]
MSQPGRVCPIQYHYRPQSLCRDAVAVDAEVLYIVGGLYGNTVALETLQSMAAGEAEQGRRVHWLFNGDFNWFNVDSEAFAAINRVVLRHDVVLGNVEWELTDPDESAGCGCAYPGFVEDAVVERSNRIIQRLRHTARQHPELCAALRGQPRYRAYHIGGQTLLVLHGDPESLAGWGLAHEYLRDPDHQPLVDNWLLQTGADVIASTHTCLPALYQSSNGGVVINNGSAGMGNFRNDPRGVITRISTAGSHPDALYGTSLGSLTVEALPVAFNRDHWWTLFRSWWPEGSDADMSYGERIRRGTALEPKQALIEGAGINGRTSDV